LLVFAAVGPAISERARATDDITIGELLRARLGRVTEQTLSVVGVVVALMIIAMQLFVAGNLFATVLDSSSMVGIGLVVVIVGVYLFAGGYGTVVMTDVFQFFVIASLAIFPLVEMPPLEKVMAFETLGALGPRTAFAFAMLGFLVTLGSAENWQRVYSARDRNVIRFAFPLAGVAILWMNLSLVFVGMAVAARLAPGTAPTDAFYQIFALPLSPWLLALLAVVVLAACISTLDTLVYLSASTLARNLLPVRLTSTRHAYVRLTRVVILFVLVVTGGLALTISDFILFMFKTVSLIAVLGPVYLVVAIGLPRQPKPMIDRGVTFATIASLVLYSYLFAQGYLDDELMLLVPPLVNTTLCGVIIGLGSRVPAEAA
jgi:solute:Na+ symporter, SSS family